MTAPPSAGPAAPAVGRSAVERLRRGLGELVGALHGVGAAAGLEHVVAPLVAECSRPNPAGARVVVAGSTKRGKSALVNAVLGRPGLLPVDTDVATGVHVAVRHGEVERAAVHRPGVDPRTVGLDEVDRYASERHNPGNVEDVLAVDIEIAAPVLAGGLELVDTPGVDSVVARHADVTLAALGLADALVLVVDPGRPLTAPELAFLREATTRIGHVVFVLTKIDAHREWRRVLEDDRALVERHAPRFATAPFVAVSGKLKTAADRARAAGRDAVADRVEAEAGTAALVTELTAVADELELVRLGNVVQLALVVLSRLASTLRASRPTSDPTEAARVEADREALRRVGEGGNRWAVEMKHGFRRLQLDLEARLVDVASRTDDALAESLTTWTTARGETLGRELDDAVRALWLEAAALVRARVEIIVSELVATLSAQGVEVARPELTLPGLDRAPTRELAPEDDPTSRGVAGAVSSYGAAAGLAFGAERLLVPLGLLAGIGGLGLGAAIGVAGIALRRRAMTRVREHRAAQRLAARTIVEARQHAQRAFVAHLADVSHLLETSVADLVTARQRDLKAAVTDGQRGLDAGRTEREQRRRTIDDQLAALQKLSTDAGALHQVLQSARAAGRARPTDPQEQRP